jgi:hypothetical protein
VGVLPAVRRNPTAVFLRCARQFGDVVYFRIGPRRGYLLTNPADVRHVLQDNARNYHKSPLSPPKWRANRATFDVGALRVRGQISNLHVLEHALPKRGHRRLLCTFAWPIQARAVERIQRGRSPRGEPEMRGQWLNAGAGSYREAV